eukprot:364156-Chlamydomonas_euryale.AAC.2
MVGRPALSLGGRHEGRRTGLPARLVVPCLLFSACVARGSVARTAVIESATAGSVPAWAAT